MKLIRSFLALCALALAFPAFAQATYPTPSVADINFNPPLRGTANTAVSIQTVTASVTGSVHCNLQGYTGS